MSRRRALLCGLGLFAATLAFAADDRKVPEPGVRTQEEEFHSHLEAVLPGSLLSYALPRNGDGTRRVMMLVAPPAEKPGSDEPATGEAPCDRQEEKPGAPPRLIRLDEANRLLQELPVAIPADASTLDAADLDGDGREELLVAAPGRLYRVRDEQLELLLEDEQLSWNSLHPRAVTDTRLEGEALVALHGLGTLRVYGAPREGDRWEKLVQVALPLEADLQPGGIQIHGPSASLVSHRPDGTLIFATEPQEFGRRRLRTLLLELPPDAPPVVTECWARLPGPERLMEHEFMMLDGKPVLLVTTRPADKLSLFGEKNLRLFPLEADRSRLGAAPIFEVASQMNMWQDGEAMLRDVTGDGHVDLVLVYWKGLMDDRLILDVYVAKDGGFARSPRTTGFDVQDANRNFAAYGPDVDGDGLDDLVLDADGHLWVYFGQRSPGGKRLVDSMPLPIQSARGGARGQRIVTITVTGGSSRDEKAIAQWLPFLHGGDPHFIDLDGDGRDEILRIRHGARGIPGAFQIIRIKPTG